MSSGVYGYIGTFALWWSRQYSSPILAQSGKALPNEVHECPMHICCFRWHLLTILSMWVVLCFRSCPRNQLCHRYHDDQQIMDSIWRAMTFLKWKTWKKHKTACFILGDVFVGNDPAETMSACRRRSGTWSAGCHQSYEADPVLPHTDISIQGKDTGLWLAMSDPNATNLVSKSTLGLIETVYERPTMGSRSDYGCGWSPSMSDQRAYIFCSTGMRI